MNLHLFSHENTCNTYYTLSGYREDVKELKEVFASLEPEYENWIPVEAFLKKLEYEIQPEDNLKGWLTDFRFDDDLMIITFTVYSKAYRIGALQHAIEDWSDKDLFVTFETQEFGMRLFDSNDTCPNSWYPSIACFVKNSEAEAFFNTEKEAVDYVNRFYGKEVCTDLYSAQNYVRDNERVEGGTVDFLIKGYTDYGEYPPIVV